MSMSGIFIPAKELSKISVFNNVLVDIGVNITGEGLTTLVYNNCGNGVKNLFDSYYGNVTQEKWLLTKDELLTYSKILKGVEGNESQDIYKNLNDYKKQMLVGEQLQLIIGYARKNNLIADIVTTTGRKNIDANGNYVDATGTIIAQYFIDYLTDLSIYWTQTMSAHKTMQEYHKYYITYAVRMNSTENAAKTFLLKIIATKKKST